MEDLEFDLLGNVILQAENGRINPLHSDYWGYGGLDPETRLDSYLIRLIGRDKLLPGEICEAHFRFKFIDEPRFKIEIKEGDTFHMCEGIRKIGEFKVKKVLNEKIKAKV